MFILDTLLIGGIRFVLDKVAAAADAEMNDETRLREELLNAQMQLELGDMSEREFAAIERSILARLRDIRESREGSHPGEGTYTVTGIEATFDTDEAPEGHNDGARPRPRRRKPR